MTNTQFNNFSEFLQWETTVNDTIDVKCVYIDMAQGDHVAGILLSQIVYWHLPSRHTDKTKLRVKRDGHLWLAKGREDWHDETRISPRQFDRASKILLNEGLIEKKVFKFAGNPTIHIRILQDAFLKSLAYHAGAAIDETLVHENEFAQENRDMVGIIEDAGVAHVIDTDPVPASDYIFGDSDEKTNSPNGENHLQRDNNVLSPSLREEERTLSPDEEIKKCSRCDSRKPVDDTIDPHGRCAVCLFVDAWSEYVGVRTPKYSTKHGKREYTGIDNIKFLDSNMKTRLKDKKFRSGWVFALERAGQMDHLRENSWFNPVWFVKNGINWTKIIQGTYDGWEKSNHPASYARLQAWLASRRQAASEKQAKVV